MKRRSFLLAAGAAGTLPALPQRAGATGQNSLPADAPLSIARIGLNAQDAEAVAGWYESVLGLARIGAEGNTLQLGAGNRVLLEITEAEGLRRPFPSWAGLYHTAFLLPDRAALGRWAQQAVLERIPVVGTADHRVSEAIYLTDPEGNGVEIYADRPQESWEWLRGEVSMGNAALDVPSLLAEGGPPLPGERFAAPAGTMVGHVHLQVGNALAGAAWWHDGMGFDLVRGSEAANFLSTGGYHHHIAVNQWNSQGAAPMQEGYAGLAHVTLRARDGQTPRVAHDPWGIEVRIEA
jgi:Predicted ring-cleavage extradiol dioxygenase